MDLTEDFLLRYEKVLIIDLDNDTFEEIKVNETEKVTYSGLTQWFIEFANQNGICKEDRRKFLNFASSQLINNGLKSHPEGIGFFYRRNNNEWYFMEASKMLNHEGNFALLTVKNTHRYMMREQEIENIAIRSCRDEIENYITQIADSEAACGLIIIDHPLKAQHEIYESVNYYFEKIYKYDATHIVIVLTGYSMDSFNVELANLYDLLNSYCVNIGTSYTQDEFNADTLINKALANLSHNRRYK